MTTNEITSTTQQTPTAAEERTESYPKDSINVTVSLTVNTTGTVESLLTAGDKEMDTLSSSTSTSVREVIAWTLVAVSTFLFLGLLTINMIMLCLYKTRQVKDKIESQTMCEMEGNPCYEASNVKRTTEREVVEEVHLYERVNQNTTS